MAKKVQQSYWYYRYIGECPVCGRDASYKERRCGPKPDASKVKYFNELHGLLFEYLPNTITYCGCEF